MAQCKGRETVETQSSSLWEKGVFISHNKSAFATMMAYSDYVLPPSKVGVATGCHFRTSIAVYPPWAICSLVRSAADRPVNDIKVFPCLPWFYKSPSSPFSALDKIRVGDTWQCLLESSMPATALSRLTLTRIPLGPRHLSSMDKRSFPIPLPEPLEHSEQFSVADSCSLVKHGRPRLLRSEE